MNYFGNTVHNCVKLKSTIPDPVILCFPMLVQCWLDMSTLNQRLSYIRQNLHISRCIDARNICKVPNESLAQGPYHNPNLVTAVSSHTATILCKRDDICTRTLEWPLRSIFCACSQLQEKIAPLISAHIKC